MFTYWSILGKTILFQSPKKHDLLPKTSEEWAFASYWMDFYISTFTEKYHLSQITWLWKKHCLASSWGKIRFIFEKVFENRTTARKEFDWLNFFGLKVEYLWLVSSYNLGLILETMTWHFTKVVLSFHFVMRKSQICLS